MATGVDPHTRDLDGMTPADLAEECGHSKCADYLRSCPTPELPEVSREDTVRFLRPPLRHTIYSAS